MQDSTYLQGVYSRRIAFTNLQDLEIAFNIHLNLHLLSKHLPKCPFPNHFQQVERLDRQSVVLRMERSIMRTVKWIYKVGVTCDGTYAAWMLISPVPPTRLYHPSLIADADSKSGTSL